MIKKVSCIIFDVVHAPSNNRHTNGDVIRAANLAPIALFSDHILASSIGKSLEDISRAQTVRVLYKLVPSSRGSDEMSIGFDRDREVKQQELNHKANENNYLLDLSYVTFQALRNVKKMPHMV